MKLGRLDSYGGALAVLRRAATSWKTLGMAAMPFVPWFLPGLGMFRYKTG